MTAVWRWRGNSQTANNVPTGTAVTIWWNFELISGCGSISLSIAIPSPVNLLSVSSITDSYSIQPNGILFSSYGCWQGGKIVDSIGGSINPHLGAASITVTSYVKATVWFTTNFNPCMSGACGVAPAVNWYDPNPPPSGGGGSGGGSRPPEPPYIPPEPPEPPYIPPPPPPIPREMVLQDIEDTTSIQMDFIAITIGDNIEGEIKNELPESEVDVKKYIKLSHVGPKITPLRVSGIYTITVENISGKPKLNNILIDIGSNIDHNLFEKIWIKGAIFTDNGKIFIPELTDEFKFDMEFLYDEEIEFEVIFTVFDEIELHRMPVKIKDIPYLIMNIEGPSDVDIGEEFELTYSLKNISGIDAYDITTKIDIPKQFTIVDTEGIEINNHILYWHHNLIESDGAEPSLKIKLVGRAKGTYRFHFEITDGEVFPNETWHIMDIGVYPITKLSAKVDKRIVEIDDTVVMTIDVYNKFKISKNTYIKLDLDDYILEDYDLFSGLYNESTNTWLLGDMGIEESSRLILTLKTITLGSKVFNLKGYHMRDNLFNELNIFTEVVEKTPKFSFDVTTESNTVDIDEEFCFHIKIENIRDLEILNGVLKGIFPSEFEITRSDNPNYNLENNILNIDSIGLNEIIEFNVCGKLKSKGNYTIIFTFKADNTQLEYRLINIICSDIYIQENLEHTIKIFNFDKLNKYYNLFIDKYDKLIKDFNYDNRTVKMIDIEDYTINNAEVYKGNNLKKLVDEINNKSKYVEAKYLRSGNNTLSQDPYKINPDGFLQRYGLLKSEIFHATGVIPEIINMSEYIAKWDVSNWDEKVYSGDLYDSGVFQVGIMYTNIPSNFKILKNDELQSIINRVKPAGLKGLPFYMAKQYFLLKTNFISARTQLNLSTTMEKLRFKDPYCKSNSYRWNEETMQLDLFQQTFDPINYKMKMKMNSQIQNSKSDLLFDKIRFKPIETKSAISTDKKEYKNIKDFSKCISSDNLININLSKEIDLDTSLRTYNKEIALSMHNKPTMSFDEAPKYGMQKMFLGNDTLILKIDYNIIDNTEFGYYFGDKNTTITFSRSHYLNEGQDGIKISIIEKGIEDILYSNVLDKSEYIYLMFAKIGDLILFYYSQDGVNFNYNREFILNFDATDQGLYLMNKNANIDMEYLYKCYEYREINTNNLPVYQRIQDDIKTSKAKLKNITVVNNDLEWENEKYINKDTGSYAKCTNNSTNIQKISPLLISFEDMEIHNLDEIEKIDLNVKTQSNAEINLNGSILLNSNIYESFNEVSEIKYPQSIKNIKTVSKDLKWKNIDGAIDALKENSYCKNYNSSTTDWIELTEFNYSINGDHLTTEVIIEGANNSNSNISCRLQMVSKEQRSAIYTIDNIKAGNFEKTLTIKDLFKIENINNDTFGFRIQFLNIDKESTVELSKISSKISYKNKSIQKPEIIQSNNNIIDPNISSKWSQLKSENLWGLTSSKPHQITGYDLKNGILAYLDFGTLNPSENIKVYSVEIIIYYKNNHGKFISDLIKGKVAKSGQEYKINYINQDIIDETYFTNYATDINQDNIILDQNKYDTWVIDGNKKEGIDLKEELYQQFEATSTELSAIEFLTSRPSGYPPKYIKMEIFTNSNSNLPDKLLKKQYIEGWNSVTFGNNKYDLHITDLKIGEKYWIKLSLPEYNKFNYYTLKYKEGSIYTKGLLMIKENGVLTKINYGDAALAFKLYTSKPIKSVKKLPIIDKYDTDLKITNRLRRKNKTRNLKIHNTTIRYGE